MFRHYNDIVLNIHKANSKQPIVKKLVEFLIYIFVNFNANGREGKVYEAAVSYRVTLVAGRHLYSAGAQVPFVSFTSPHTSLIIPTNH